MGLSIFGSKNKGNGFDVLSSQTEPIKKPLRFEDIPKPTELKPLLPIGKVEKNPTAGEAGEISAAEKVEKFIVPRELTEYIRKLIKGGRKLKVLEFDVSEAVSETQIKSILNAKLDTGLISESEKREMLGILTGSKPEIKMENKKDEALKLVVEEQDEHPVRLRRKKVQNLKSTHGIIVEGVGDTHTPLEQGIIDKSTKLWKGTDRETEISLQFLKGASLEFHIEPEPVVASPLPIVKSFDGVFRKKVKEPAKSAVADRPTPVEPEFREKAAEIVAPRIIVTENKEEKPIGKPIGKIVEKPQSNTLTVDFQGRVVRAVNERGIVTVTFDGKEIAKGLAMDIKIKKEFKAGFLFAKTAEEQAFEKALPLIKSFKN